jgi:lactaldehyde reductase
VWTDFKANPTVENVKTGVAAYAKSGADFIVVVGGGSAIDTAKAIGIISNNPEFSDVVSLEGFADTKNKSVPLIALPTTAGTAAEVTVNYVITDEVSGRKMVCIDANDIPIVAIVDAELMATMPAALAAATGMDALTHAIEGYITRGAWELADTLNLKAIELISKNLVAATKGDMTALEAVALGQYMTGMAFSNVGLGAVHSMAHPLGARFDIAHGVANALLLPIVMEFNAPAASAKYGEIAKAMGAKGDAVSAVKELSEALNIPVSLKALGIPEGALKQLANDAFKDVCTGGNPRDISEADMLALYKKAF